MEGTILGEGVDKHRAEYSGKKRDIERSEISDINAFLDYLVEIEQLQIHIIYLFFFHLQFIKWWR